MIDICFQLLTFILLNIDTFSKIIIKHSLNQMRIFFFCNFILLKKEQSLSLSTEIWKNVVILYSEVIKIYELITKRFLQTKNETTEFKYLLFK